MGSVYSGDHQWRVEGQWHRAACMRCLYVKRQAVPHAVQYSGWCRSCWIWAFLSCHGHFLALMHICCFCVACLAMVSLWRMLLFVVVQSALWHFEHTSQAMVGRIQTVRMLPTPGRKLGIYFQQECLVSCGFLHACGHHDGGAAAGLPCCRAPITNAPHAACCWHNPCFAFRVFADEWSLLTS